MTLPRYVALDRWIRRNPVTASGLQGVVTLAVTLWVVGKISTEFHPAVGLAAIFLVVALMYFTILLVRDVLEYFADQWRESP